MAEKPGLPKLGLLDLPNEILLKILQDLDTDDIHFRCAKINKRFKVLIDNAFDTSECLTCNGKEYTGYFANGNSIRMNLSDFNDWCKDSKPNVKALKMSLHEDDFSSNPEENEELEAALVESLEQLKTLKFLVLEVETPLQNRASLQQCWRIVEHLEFLAVDSMFLDIYDRLETAKNLKTLVINLLRFQEGDPFCISSDPLAGIDDDNTKEAPSFNATNLLIKNLGAYDETWMDPKTDIVWILQHFPKVSREIS